MAWVIFKPDDRLVEAAVPNEATATTRVAALGGTTTSMEVDDGEGGSTLPPWFYVGCYVDTGGVLYGDVPMPDVDRLQWAARGATDALVGLSRAARNLVGRVYASLEHARVHDWIAYTLPGLARVCRSTHWTIAQRVAFCERTGALSVADLYGQAATTTAPTSAVVLTDPSTATRSSLTGSAEATRIVSANWGTAPTSAALTGGTWIDELAG